MEDCENGKIRIEDSCEGEDLLTMLDNVQYHFEAGVILRNSLLVSSMLVKQSMVQCYQGRVGTDRNC